MFFLECEPAAALKLGELGFVPSFWSVPAGRGESGFAPSFCSVLAGRERGECVDCVVFGDQFTTLPDGLPLLSVGRVLNLKEPTDEQFPGIKKRESVK